MNRVFLSPGLEDASYTLLSTSTWNELQNTSAEAAQASSCDFWAFSERCLYFAVIKESGEPLAEEGNQPNEDAAGTYHTFDDNAVHANKRNPNTTRNAAQEAQSIGFIFLTSSPANGDTPAGEVNIGCIIDPPFRGNGFAKEAVNLVLQWAFDEVGFHRVQASVLDTASKAPAFGLFIQMGFGHEGTRRRAIYSASDGVWKDVHVLAVLDTEWSMRSFFKPAPRSMWDEMFLRHSRERDALLRWEEGKAKQGSSTDTLCISTSTTPTTSRASSVFDGDVSEHGRQASALTPYPFSPEEGNERSAEDSWRSRLPWREMYDILQNTSTERFPLSHPDDSGRATPTSTSLYSSDSSESELPVAHSPAGSQWDLMDSSDSSSSLDGVESYSDIDSD